MFIGLFLRKREANERYVLDGYFLVLFIGLFLCNRESMDKTLEALEARYLPEGLGERKETTGRARIGEEVGLPES